MAIVEVAIPVPLNKTFDYLCDGEVTVGARVRVPFVRKKVNFINRIALTAFVVEA
jgi:replication restart DNA helicase PriA